MVWDISLITAALLGVFLLLAILTRIWRDQTMENQKADAGGARALSSQPPMPDVADTQPAQCTIKIATVQQRNRD